MASTKLNKENILYYHKLIHIIHMSVDLGSFRWTKSILALRAHKLLSATLSHAHTGQKEQTYKKKKKNSKTK